MGGGGFGFLNAIELRDICPNLNNCQITSNYGEVTNSGDLAQRSYITLQAGIDTFINYGTITNTGDSVINIGTLNQRSGQVGSIINYGSIVGNIWVNHTGRLDSITNYGYMGNVGIAASVSSTTTINNLGIMSWHSGGLHGINIGTNSNYSVLIQNYAIRIDENADTFSKFNPATTTTEQGKTSHLTIGGNTNSGGVHFKDSKSKIILDFGDNFELGKEYSIAKLVTDTQQIQRDESRC